MPQRKWMTEDRWEERNMETMDNRFHVPLEEDGHGSIRRSFW